MSRAPPGGGGRARAHEPQRAAGERTRAGTALFLLCAAFMAGFLALGVWQVQRLAWKRDLIARVEARIHAEPVPAPDSAAFARLAPAEAEYRRVSLSGHFLNDRETLVQAVTALGGGFWVLTPFATDGGFTVLVNRGFVPPEMRSPQLRASARTEGATSLTGLLRLSEPGGGFLRANDPSAERWYSRDVDAILAARGVPEGAPYFVDAEARDASGAYPVGGLTVVRFTNNHLVYALTWFALAGLCAFGCGMVCRRTATPAEGEPANTNL